MVFIKNALAALALVAVAAAQSSINTPTSLIQCQPYALTWTAGAGGPYFVSVIPGGEPSGTPLAQLGTFPSGTTSYAWTVDIPSGTSITIKIIDSSGVPNYSDQVTVLAGSSTCDLASAGTGGAAASSTSGAAASSSGTALNTPRSSTTAGASSTSAGSSSSSTTASRSGSNTAAGASATPTGAASHLAAGSLLGLVGAAMVVMA